MGCRMRGIDFRSGKVVVFQQWMKCWVELLCPHVMGGE